MARRTRRRHRTVFGECCCPRRCGGRPDCRCSSGPARTTRRSTPAPSCRPPPTRRRRAPTWRSWPHSSDQTCSQPATGRSSGSCRPGRRSPDDRHRLSTATAAGRYGLRAVELDRGRASSPQWSESLSTAGDRRPWCCTPICLSTRPASPSVRTGASSRSASPPRMAPAVHTHGYDITVLTLGTDTTTRRWSRTVALPTHIGSNRCRRRRQSRPCHGRPDGRGPGRAYSLGDIDAPCAGRCSAASTCSTRRARPSANNPRPLDPHVTTDGFWSVERHLPRRDRATDHFGGMR